jgi:hypothetical protein
MALIRGSRGLIYFVHQFKPNFREAALLDDPEMLAAITALNKQIRDLAPVLNQPMRPDALAITTENPGSQVIAMTKFGIGTHWVFAANLKNEPARATFQFIETNRRLGPDSEAEVLDENRKVLVKHGERITDDFAPYAVHLYRLGPPPPKAGR